MGAINGQRARRDNVHELNARRERFSYISQIAPEARAPIIPQESGEHAVPFAARLDVRTLPLDGGARFLDALVEAGLMRSLDAKTTLALLTTRRSRIDVLCGFYEGEPSRRLDDRFLLCGRGGAATLKEVAAALSELATDMPTLCVERIGDAIHGQLVLTSGEGVRPILDEEDDDTTVSVDAIVHAFNGFLRETGTTTRLVPLAADDDRIAYVGLPLAKAVDLANAGMLEVDGNAELVEFGDW